MKRIRITNQHGTTTLTLVTKHQYERLNNFLRAAFIDIPHGNAWIPPLYFLGPISHDMVLKALNYDLTNNSYDTAVPHEWYANMAKRAYNDQNHINHPHNFVWWYENGDSFGKPLNIRSLVTTELIPLILTWIIDGPPDHVTIQHHTADTID